MSLNLHQGESSIPLTPAQAIRIHGWLNPLRRLFWQAHVVPRPDLTFSTLLQKLSNGNSLHDDQGSVIVDNHALMLLHHLQPSAKVWIELKKVTLEDCEVMHKFWDIHPMRDFVMEDPVSGLHEVHVGDILEAGLSFEALKGCKVTLDDLAKAGLNPDNMRLFHFSLYQWKQLGFSELHASVMSAAQVETVFGMTKQTLEASFME